MMFKLYDMRLSVVSVLLLFSVAAGVEKPKELTKTCVTAECHTGFTKKAHIHAPVGLGDCKSCHDVDNVEEHKFKLVRDGKKLCEYCHLDQSAKKNVDDLIADPKESRRQKAEMEKKKAAQENAKQ